MRLLLILFLASQILAQEIDITKALNEIESGNIQNALACLHEFKKTDLNDPAVIFLDGVLTLNADEAVKKYLTVYEKFPKSNYADASLYKIYSYYYALGYYKKAENYLAKLKSEYPQSAYLKTAENLYPNEEVAATVDSGKDNKVAERGNYKFTIQAGAFLNADNAEKLRAQLTKDGFSSEIKTKEIGGSVFNIVLVGKYQTEVETESAKKILDEKYSLNARIVNLK